MTQREKLGKLLAFDTPSITNVVATYPRDRENCLGLYHPWQSNWYTDQSLRCMYPEMGRRVGYAVTCVYGPPDPYFDRLSLLDVLKAIERTEKPVILVIQQNMPPEMKNKNGLCGGNMTSAFKALGVTGVISDGPSRDLDECRPMGVQYMLTGVTPGHGDFSVQAVNVPVSVCGMDVAPGEIIHMDENGAVKFPADQFDAVLQRATALQAREGDMQRAIQNATCAEEIIALMKGTTYVKKV